MVGFDQSIGCRMAKFSCNGNILGWSSLGHAAQRLLWKTSIFRYCVDMLSIYTFRHVDISKPYQSHHYLVLLISVESVGTLWYIDSYLSANISMLSTISSLVSAPSTVLDNNSTTKCHFTYLIPQMALVITNSLSHSFSTEFIFIFYNIVYRSDLLYLILQNEWNTPTKKHI